MKRLLAIGLILLVLVVSIGTLALTVAATGTTTTSTTMNLPSQVNEGCPPNDPSCQTPPLCRILGTC